MTAGAEPHVLPRPPEWSRDAACEGMAAGEFDPWHPDEGDPAAAFLFALARRVCADCPVRLDCARAGVDLLAVAVVQGMWGGLTPGELRRLARAHGYPARVVAQHGTRSRYVTGCRCRPCVRSNSRAEHVRRTRIVHGATGLRNWRAGCSRWPRGRVSHLVTDGGAAYPAGLGAVWAGRPNRADGPVGQMPGEPARSRVRAHSRRAAQHAPDMDRPGHREVTGPETAFLRRD